MATCGPFVPVSLPQASPASAADECSNRWFSLARVLGVAGIISLLLFFSGRCARRSSVARYPVAIPLDPLALGSGVEIDGDEDDEIDLDDELGPELEGPAGHQLLPAPDTVAVMHNNIGEQNARQTDEAHPGLLRRPPDTPG